MPRKAKKAEPEEVVEEQEDVVYVLENRRFRKNKGEKNIIPCAVMSISRDGHMILKEINSGRWHVQAPPEKVYHQYELAAQELAEGAPGLNDGVKSAVFSVS